MAVIDQVVGDGDVLVELRPGLAGVVGLVAHPDGLCRLCAAIVEDIVVNQDVGSMDRGVGGPDLHHVVMVEIGVGAVEIIQVVVLHDDVLHAPHADAVGLDPGDRIAGDRDPDHFEHGQALEIARHGVVAEGDVLAEAEHAEIFAAHRVRVSGIVEAAGVAGEIDIGDGDVAALDHVEIGLPFRPLDAGAVHGQFGHMDVLGVVDVDPADRDRVLGVEGADRDGLGAAILEVDLLPFHARVEQNLHPRTARTEWRRLPVTRLYWIRQSARSAWWMTPRRV